MDKKSLNEIKERRKAFNQKIDALTNQRVKSLTETQINNEIERKWSLKEKTAKGKTITKNDRENSLKT